MHVQLDPVLVTDCSWYIRYCFSQGNKDQLLLVYL